MLLVLLGVRIIAQMKLMLPAMEDDPGINSALAEICQVLRVGFEDKIAQVRELSRQMIYHSVPKYKDRLNEILMCKMPLCLRTEWYAIRSVFSSFFRDVVAEPQSILPVNQYQPSRTARMYAWMDDCP